MLYKMFLTFDSVDEILNYDHSNESSTAVFSGGTDCFSIFQFQNDFFFLSFDLGRYWE